MSETETALTEQEVDAVRRARETADAMPLASNAIGDLYAMVRRLDAELTRLTKALPKTADGVTVIPGMEVFYCYGECSVDPVRRLRVHRVVSGGRVQGFDGGTPHPISADYHSDPEPIWSSAALAAEHWANVCQRKADEAAAAAEAAKGGQ